MTPATLLDVWERGATEAPFLRAVRLLRVFLPEAPSDELARLDIARRDEMLLRLRRQLFGSRLVCVVDCPACRDRMELETSVEGLLSAGLGQDDGPPLHAAGFEIAFRLPTTLDLTELAERGGRDGQDLLLRRCVVEARRDGASVNPDGLPADALAALGEALTARAALADIRFAAQCESCSRRWNPVFDIGSYLWAELDSWARQLVTEIHCLASAYGWAEAEILALSPSRRRAYLGLVQA